MKTWYIAVCDKCGKARNVMVTNPIHTYQYLEGANKQITEFLSQHYGCELRLICRDDQLDKLWEDGWKRVEGKWNKKGKKEMPCWEYERE
jgi:hypothetical protein